MDESLIVKSQCYGETVIEEHKSNCFCCRKNKVAAAYWLFNTFCIRGNKLFNFLEFFRLSLSHFRNEPYKQKKKFYVITWQGQIQEPFKISFNMLDSYRIIFSFLIELIFFLVDFFFTGKLHVWRAILGHVRGENKKKQDCQFFFLVGPDSSSSQDTSAVEYSECGLRRDN